MAHLAQVAHLGHPGQIYQKCPVFWPRTDHFGSVLARPAILANFGKKPLSAQIYADGAFVPPWGGTPHRTWAPPEGVQTQVPPAFEVVLGPIWGPNPLRMGSRWHPFCQFCQFRWHLFVRKASSKLNLSANKSVGFLCRTEQGGPKFNKWSNLWYC